MVVDIILPYAVTLPLTLMARAARDRSNYEKNKATQYLLDPLVFNHSSRQLTPLLEMQRQVLQRRAVKQRRTTQSPHDVSSEHALKFTPYSVSYAACSRLHNEVADTHLFHTAFTLDELFNSWDKLDNFYDGFYNTF